MVEEVVFDTDGEAGWKVLEHKHKGECRVPEKTLSCAKLEVLFVASKGRNSASGQGF